MKPNTLPLGLRNGAVRSSAESITVGSRFDFRGSRQFARAVARLAGRKVRHPIVDLSRTHSVDSSAFGALVLGLRRLAEAGSRPVVICANSSVRRLMDFAGVTRSFAVVGRLSEARKLIAREKAQQQETDALAS